MLSLQEEKFIAYWQEKRGENKLSPFFFIKGFAIGLIMGVLVIISVVTGWYKRAYMDANTKLNPYLLLVAIVLIAVFLAVFYNSFKYEQNEQLYKELKRKITYK